MTFHPFNGRVSTSTYFWVPPSTLVVMCGCWLLMRMSFGFTQHTSTHSRNKRQAFLTSRDTSSPSQCHKAMVVCFKKEVCQASIFSAFVLFLSLWKQHNMEGGGCQRMVSQPQEKPLTGRHRDEGFTRRNRRKSNIFCPKKGHVLVARSNRQRS